MKVTVKTEGFAELDAALGEFTRATAKNILRRAGEKALRPVAAAMAAKAPYDENGDRDLRNSIDVTTKLNNRQKRLNNSPSTVEVYAGPTARTGDNPPPQGIFQEFGTENHPPQAFARPAWDQGRDQVLASVKASLTDEIEKGRKRAARRALKPKKG